MDAISDPPELREMLSRGRGHLRDGSIALQTGMYAMFDFLKSMIGKRGMPLTGAEPILASRAFRAQRDRLACRATANRTHDGSKLARRRPERDRLRTGSAGSGEEQRILFSRSEHRIEV